MNPVPVIPYGQQRGLSPAARRRWIAFAVVSVLVLVVAIGLYQWGRAVAMESARAEARAQAAKQFELSPTAVQQAATQPAADE